MIIDILFTCFLTAVFMTVFAAWCYFACLIFDHRIYESRAIALLCGPIAWIYRIHPGLLFAASFDELNRIVISNTAR